jgi:microcystin-dependent protein
MHFFKKKYVLDPLFEQRSKARRSFIKKSAAVLLGATILTRAEDLFSIESKTGYVYVKKNGEIINDYQRMGGAEPFLAQMNFFGFNFAPNGWYKCEGQVLSPFTSSALFSLLGTYYGGNGSTTFNLPDLRGRVPVHYGQGGGLSLYNLGDMGGTELVSLTTSEIPSHSHTITASTAPGSSPKSNALFVSANAEGINSFHGSADTTMNAAELADAGSSQGHNNMQPSLALNLCIAYQGVFPTRP